ncbi:hypothetical protein [Nitrosopumilus sp.]|uniref:hypothetical protein n=1 Tax=Nitrosopumilus sp. TaxID=2024843 RepID=UPI003D0AA57A
MKTILTLSIMAILATGVTAPALQEAFAFKANTSEKLSPKAYGQKTINAKCGETTCFVKQTAKSESLSQIEKNLMSDPRIQKYIAQYNYAHGITP